MKAILTDLLAIIGVVLNGLPQGLLALTFGFASVPTALAFFVGAVGNTITQSVAPISFQAETITYAGTAGKDRSERCTMIFIGGVIMALIGVFGLLTKIVNFVGEDVAYGMMAGVGIILVKAAIDMIKSDAISGGVSLAAALITYYFTKDSANTLVYTIVISVVASCIANAIFNKEKSSIIVEDDKLDLALDIIAKAKAKGVNLVLGSDCVAADAFSNDAHTQVVPANNIPDGWEGLDAGPETQKAFAAAIEDAKTILWNGPAGVFEFDNFTAGSRAIAEAIAKATKNGAFSLIGGGDSVACINKFGMADQVSYISTGGGALLEAIEGKILPGVAAIKGE